MHVLSWANRYKSPPIELTAPDRVVSAHLTETGDADMNETCQASVWHSRFGCT